MSKDKIAQNDELRFRFTAWITTVVQRAKIDYIRKQNRQPKSVPLDSVAEDEFCTACNYNSAIESAKNFEFDDENVAKAFSALSSLRQKILALMFVQGKTAEQVATILGCSTKHVFNEKSIALKQIREFLRKNNHD